jgi:hypothetical protein
MTAQALAGICAGLLLAALVVIFLLERRRERAEVDAWARREDNRELSVRIAVAEAELDATAELLEESRRSAEVLELELAKLRGELEESDLVGELVIVNTPRPDDQTLKGVCRRDRGPDRGLVLEAAVYLEPRGQGQVAEVAAGDVVVPAYSWAQIVHRTEEG